MITLLSQVNNTNFQNSIFKIFRKIACEDNLDHILSRSIFYLDQILS